jgi:ketopantoate reductase
MKTLIVGAGALGGIIGARLLAAGASVSLATRNAMLQDFERGRTTEIDFINGYVVDTARQFGVNTPLNTAIVETVHAITRGQSAPDPNHLLQILQTSVDRGEASVPFPLSNKGEKQ